MKVQVISIKNNLVTFVNLETNEEIELPLDYFIKDYPILENTYILEVKGKIARLYNYTNKCAIINNYMKNFIPDGNPYDYK